MDTRAISLLVALSLGSVGGSARSDPLVQSVSLDAVDTPELESSSELSPNPHHGWYLRANLGLGALASRLHDPTAGDRHLSATHPSMAFDAFIGGSPMRQLALGGALFFETYVLTGTEAASSSDARDVTSVLIGPFLETFPSRLEGWHFGAMMGIGSLQSELAGNLGFESRGLGVAFWAGYDVSLGGAWALGPQLRLMGLRTVPEFEPDVTGWAQSATLSLSALYR